MSRLAERGREERDVFIQEAAAEPRDVAGHRRKGLLGLLAAWDFLPIRAGNLILSSRAVRPCPKYSMRSSVFRKTSTSRCHQYCLGIPK